MTLEITRRFGSAILPWVATAACTLFGLLATDIRSEIATHRDQIAELREWRAGAASVLISAKERDRRDELQAAENAKLWAKIADLNATLVRDMSAVKEGLAEIRTEVRLLSRQGRVQ